MSMRRRRRKFDEFSFQRGCTMASRNQKHEPRGGQQRQRRRRRSAPGTDAVNGIIFLCCYLVFASSSPRTCAPCERPFRDHGRNGVADTTPDSFSSWWPSLPLFVAGSTVEQDRDDGDDDDVPKDTVGRRRTTATTTAFLVDPEDKVSKHEPQPGYALDTRRHEVAAMAGIAENLRAATNSRNHRDGNSQTRGRSLEGAAAANEPGGPPQRQRQQREQQRKRPPSLNEILVRAARKGLGGGIPGAAAGVVQVMSLMWLRTIISYQCRYGTTFRQALSTLLNEGGVRRLYRGLCFALVQAPMARFVSTAANDGVEALLASFESTRAWGPERTTAVASVVVGMWRIFLMPIDTMKTVSQVDSTEGFRHLMRRVRAGKFSVLYQGSVAVAISATLGHYPWFYTYNMLSGNEWIRNAIPWKLLRDAWIGLISSIVSDTVVNVTRVVKTTKQSVGSKHSSVGYLEVVQMILAADGWMGLFGRGLRSRIYANALQSIIFTVLWRTLADRWSSTGTGTAA